WDDGWKRRVWADLEFAKRPIDHTIDVAGERVARDVGRNRALRGVRGGVDFVRLNDDDFGVEVVARDVDSNTALRGPRPGASAVVRKHADFAKAAGSGDSHRISHANVHVFE